MTPCLPLRTSAELMLEGALILIIAFLGKEGMVPAVSPKASRFGSAPAMSDRREEQTFERKKREELRSSPCKVEGAGFRILDLVQSAYLNSLE